MTDTLKKLKKVQAHIVKELTGNMANDELLEGEDMMGIASAEIIDSDGDIVLIEGIDVFKYHNPPQKNIKVLASHMHNTISGEPSIIGRVERFWKTKVKVGNSEVNALAFAFSFAKDSETDELTPLARAYKRLMPKYLDSFSVGMIVDDYEIEEATKGFRVLKSTLIEISAVAIPANAEATVKKQIQKVFDEELDEEDKQEDIVFEEYKEEDIVEEEEKQEDPNTPNDIYEDVKNLIETGFASIEKRLDSIESSIVVMTNAANEQSDDQQERSDSEIESLKTITQALEKIKSLNTERK